MFGLVLLLLIVVPIVELWALSSVADAIGWLPSIGILLSISVVGGILMRWQTVGAVARVTSTLRKGRMPTNELTDAALMIFGAALLLTPGFFTDAFGLAMFIPPTRAIARRFAIAQGRKRTKAFTVTAGAPFGAGFGSPGTSGSGRPGDVIDIEEVDIEEVDIQRTPSEPTQREPSSRNQIPPIVPPGAPLS